MLVLYHLGKHFGIWASIQATSALLNQQGPEIVHPQSRLGGKEFSGELG